MKFLGIKASQRKKSNSTALLEQLLAGARAQGAETEIITPWMLDLKPCLGCDGCMDDGLCDVKDDFHIVYEQILSCDVLVLATPVYFGAVSAQAKILIDRCECFWNQTYILKEPIPVGPYGRRRRGVLIATAGQDREIMFAGPRVTFDFLMRSLGGDFVGELLYGEMDEPGAIVRNNEAMDRAFVMGQELAGSKADDC
ncbi:MAG: flavodoxin family protein [Anaerolineales bacterium]|nr:flavodoxin family protein [Anaerolineales bacterium]